MPRWKDLPEELDPQIREFTSQLRRLVDRSGLSVAAVADRTGYSKTSWERYLGGRLLAPKGAIVALAEVTGTNPVHLTTMWELAERAWSRSEMRHDMTMEAMKISQARAALSEFGPPPAGAPAAGAKNKSARKGGNATATPGIAGPAGVVPSVPTVPAQPTAPDADARENGAAASPGRTNSWGLAGYTGPSPVGPRGPKPNPTTTPTPGARPATTSTPGPAASPTPGSYGEPPHGAQAADQRRGPGGRGRRLGLLLAGVVGVLATALAAYLLTSRGGDAKEAAPTPSPTPTATKVKLPPGVKCSGESCTGKDAEDMGCGGELATTAQSVTVGTTLVEVRYSETCAAAWGRINQAVPGDAVRVTVGGAVRDGSVTEAGDTDAYTPMIAVRKATDAVACVTLTSGEKGCTR
ncbi:helix-turn-helix domain-containing protein [Streptomyces flavalbus]|uniref:Helix-turn-helix domain-containing protein n=1 Tax=Streptomyces flavalbus TaxID=2665155 RepID=A0ABW2WBN5_9ACTN